MPMQSRRATYGSGLRHWRSNRDLRLMRWMNGTSSKPCVVRKITRWPFRSSKEFVAIVVPSTKNPISAGGTPLRRNASNTARAGCRGVDGTLTVRRAPVSSSMTTRSVNVPPVSTPIRMLGTECSVDDERLAGQVGRRVEDQVPDHVCDLGGLRVAAGRNRADERRVATHDRRELLLDARHHRRVDAARADRVDADAVARNLARERARQADEGMLRGAVRRHVFDPGESGAGRNVHDPSVLLLLQVWKHSSEQMERPGDVRLEDLGERFRSDLLERGNRPYDTG